MATLDPTKTGDTYARVEDYLADKIQTSADLESVDDLLARVREQQELLRKQLAEAKDELNQAETTASQHCEALRDRAGAFQRRQADLDRELHVLTQSKVSENAVEIFESRMNTLRRLEVASGYVELLREVDLLVTNARAKGRATEDALVDHSRLRSLLAGLHQAQVAAEEAAPHLIAEVEQQVEKLYKQLKGDLEIDLHKTLEEMAWPKKELKLLGDVVQSWRKQVESLLELQEATLQSTTFDGIFNHHIIILLPLQTMVTPLILRFQYHFYGDRPTNRLDKPEYFFSHILDLLEQHNSFLSQLLQPILDSRVEKHTNLDTMYTDAVSAFINALLPTVSAKCLSILPQVSKQPQLYSHFMHELMVFDSALRESWGYTPIAGPSSDWKGLTYEMLVTHGYFKSWLETEKSFALTRYKRIRDNSDSNQIDYDTVEPGRTKPTKGAIRINDLLETITDRYRALSSFSQKLTFLLDIQISIFDDYHRFLYDAFQAYVASSHTMGRLLQGGSQSQDDAMGMKGLETLIKIFGSSEFLERKMSDWSEDIFFLELWDELEYRAKGKAGTVGPSVGRDLNFEEVAAKTSVSLRANADSPAHDNNVASQADQENGALFDETCASFRSLRERAETEIIRALETLSRNSLKRYLDLAIWGSLSSTTSANYRELSPSSALDTLLNTLATLLSYLAKTLAQAPLRRITRQLCLSIQKEIIDNVVNRHSFSAAGAAQLRRDVLAIQDAIDDNIVSTSSSATTQTSTKGQAKKSMKKLEDTLILLNLPIKASSTKMPPTLLTQDSTDSTLTTSSSINTDIEDDDGEGDGWGFNDPDDDDQDILTTTNTTTNHDPTNNNTIKDPNDQNQQGEWGLWQAEKAFFFSNESARRALSAMSIDHVTEIEARGIIRRRVEIGS